MILDQFRRGTNESLFGLSTPYTEADLKKAYRTLAKRYHPDTSPYSRDFCDEVMKLINQKYDYMKKLLALGQSSQQDASQDSQDSWRDWGDAAGRRTQHERTDEDYYYSEAFRRGYQEGYAQGGGQQQEEKKKSPVVISRKEQVMRILNLIVMAGTAFYVGRAILLWEDSVFTTAVIHSFKTYRHIDVAFRTMFFGYVLAIALCVIAAQFFNAIAYDMRSSIGQLLLSAIRGAVIAAAAIVLVWGIMIIVSEGGWKKHGLDMIVVVLIAVVIPARVLLLGVKGYR